MILDKLASVWRTSKSGAGYSDGQIYASIQVAIVPISKLDRSNPYAYEATHVLWVPFWLDLRKEDQVRYGRRLPDSQGNVVPYIYVINGKATYSLGVSQVMLYATERE